MAGRARGRLESWQKWSFLQPAPPGQQRPGRLDAGPQEAADQPVLTRQRADRGARPGPGLEPGGEPRCEVELTEVRTPGQDWWTLGFEATSPAGLLRSALEATAALVFARAMPGGMEPGPADSRSYAEWLDSGEPSETRCSSSSMPMPRFCRSSATVNATSADPDPVPACS